MATMVRVWMMLGLRLLGVQPLPPCHPLQPCPTLQNTLWPQTDPKPHQITPKWLSSFFSIFPFKLNT